jgi:mono/diheme cytochrome c family protein
MRVVFVAATAAVFALSARAEDPSSPKVDFIKDVRPIFEARCFACHGPMKQKGDLRLDRKATIAKGGHSGAVVTPGKSGDSLLVKHLLGDELERMPPKGESLSKEQIELVRRWIDQGAVIARDVENPKSATDANADWAFKPITKPKIPTPPPSLRSWVRTPIDAFVLDKLRSKRLQPSPEADRRTLCRRLYVDLTGLTPLPEEIDAFVKNPAADAYERLVDKLLSSPRYGERWARHWLDVAHYADSHGHDQDRPRPNAWPYRDYVVRSFNADKPYAMFVSEQVAGDVLHLGDAESLRATGFLAAGPWDESGLRDIQADSIDREAARYLDRDDIVTSTMSTFAGVTVGCARCHDHKFDPIPQEDYYALQAVFAGTDKADRAIDADPKTAERRKVIASELEHVRSLKDKSRPEFLTLEHQSKAAAFEAAAKDREKAWTILTPTEWKSKQGTSLKALLDKSILAVGKRPDRDTYIVSAKLDGRRATGIQLELLCDDTLPHQGPGRQDNGNLHLSEIKVTVHPSGKPDQAIPVSIKRATADFDQSGWEVPRAIDGDATTAWGIHPEVGKPHLAILEFEKPIDMPNGVITVMLDQLHGEGHLIGRFRLSVATAPITDSLDPIPSAIASILAVTNSKRTTAQKSEVARWLLQRRLEREQAYLPPTTFVYCGTNLFKPDGSFKPTESPRVIHLLKRGEVTKPEKSIPPGSLRAIATLPAKFSLNGDSDGKRRAALAAWLADRNNPLTWRVIVNRVWHYHFGRGIVDTPNDFGKMGGTPSHPELLDWLAAEFRDHGGSLKELHRLILTSSVYRQQVRHDAVAAERDSDNRFLWRMNRGRLDAESVRDSVLRISGRLDEAMYGPPAKHFIVKPGVHVTPDADYESFDVDSAEARRRSVYRFILRTRPDPLLGALDCPEASLSAPVRVSSMGAPQALVLWNNKFMLRSAEHLAMLGEKPSKDLTRQVRFVAERVLCRKPTAAEESTWTAFAKRHGLANFCRVLWSSSEFLFID